MDKKQVRFSGEKIHEIDPRVLAYFKTLVTNDTEFEIFRDDPSKNLSMKLGLNNPEAAASFLSLITNLRKEPGPIPNGSQIATYIDKKKRGPAFSQIEKKEEGVGWDKKWDKSSPSERSIKQEYKYADKGFNKNGGSIPTIDDYLLSNLGSIFFPEQPLVTPELIKYLEEKND